MVGGRARFRRSDRLRSSKDFQRVSREGRRRVSRHFVVLVAPKFEAHGDPTPRLGVTASRKVGNAVVRNRVKRGIRQWFRRARPSLPQSVDLVVIARPGTAQLSGKEAEDELMDLFR